MAPLEGTTASSAIRSAVRAIQPNCRLSARERLDIYRRSYWCRLLESFRDDFPGLAAVLGPKRFERLARAYIADCPSQSYTLRDLGSRLAGWLSEHPDCAGDNHQLALDMVRLEWAHIVAFDAGADTALGPGELASSGPAMRVGLQPYVSMLHLRHPVDEMRIQANKNEDGRAAASHTTLERGRPRKTALTRAKAGECYVAVHRVDLSVYYRRLSREEYRVLCALRDGQTISRAIQTAFTDTASDGEGIAQLLTTWFRTWAEFGWLTTKPKRRRRP